MGRLLESGAYSTRIDKAKPITIDEYCEFCHSNGHLFAHITNLDDISVTDPVERSKRSYANYKIMRESGLHPWPIFHANAPLKYLEEYLSDSEYIALGAIAKLSTPDRCEWLDYVFRNYLLDENHMPRFKVHGLGMTSPFIILRYPWYSVDSATYIDSASYGKIHMPYYGDAQFLYAHKLSTTYSVSNESIGHANKTERHFEQVRELDRVNIDHYLRHGCKTTYDLVAGSFRERLLVNGRFSVEFENGNPYPTKIFLSLNPFNKDQLSTAKALGLKKLILSYYYIRENIDRFLAFCEGD